VHGILGVGHALGHSRHALDHGLVELGTTDCGDELVERTEAGAFGHLERLGANLPRCTSATPATCGSMPAACSAGRTTVASVPRSSERASASARSAAASMSPLTPFAQSK